MKKGYFLIIIVLLNLSVYALFAFKSPSKNAYQHMLIVVEEKCEGLGVSIDGKEYSKQALLAKEAKGRWDLNPIINLIHQYESDGWELQSFDGGASRDGAVFTFWLRKEK